MLFRYVVFVVDWFAFHVLCDWTVLLYVWLVSYMIGKSFWWKNFKKVASSVKNRNQKVYFVVKVYKINLANEWQYVRLWIVQRNNQPTLQQLCLVLNLSFSVCCLWISVHKCIRRLWKKNHIADKLETSITKFITQCQSLCQVRLCNIYTSGYNRLNIDCTICSAHMYHWI